MSILFLIKIGISIGAVLLIVASICVTIAALFPPKEYKGDGEMPKTSVAEDEIKEDA